ncbi:MAG: biotin/lipoyl-binding protein, partial [Candidatus Competibacteraceae bacterium]
MKRFLAARQSGLIALWLAIALGGWLLSGQWREPSSVKAQSLVADSPQATDKKAMQVRVRDFQAQPISREIVVSARTEPVRAVTVRAEIDARVIAVNAEKGAPIQQGEVILRLDPRDRQARLAEAEALVKQRTLQYQAAQRLFKKNLQAENQVAEALA